jgi:hypothetical protein
MRFFSSSWEWATFKFFQALFFWGLKIAKFLFFLNDPTERLKKKQGSKIKT